MVKKYNFTSLVNNKINSEFDMIALNSEVSRRMPYIALRNELRLIYALSKSNKSSFVFKFEYKNYPNILFCADSDMNFSSSKGSIKIKENSIVTAPHHGSLHNELAYDRITDGTCTGNESLIFVRSDKNNPPGRPCDRYKILEIKYCTKCNAKYSRRANVRLEYSRKRFWVNRKICSC